METVCQNVIDQVSQATQFVNDVFKLKYIADTRVYKKEISNIMQLVNDKFGYILHEQQQSQQSMEVNDGKHIKPGVNNQGMHRKCK